MPDRAYTNEPAVNKPLALFALLRQQPHRKKHLTDEVTHALAGIKVRVWSLGARLGRTWHRNPNHDQGQHSKERGERENRLAADRARLRATDFYRACGRLPYRYRCSYEAVITEVRRLLAAGAWCEPGNYIDRTTGEIKTTLYLPEDTWGAAHLLAWCVDFLDRLLAAVPRMTEQVTRRYQAGHSTTGEGSPERRRNEGEEPDWLSRARRRWCDEQPELPATS